ncbi:MAG TPA: hypothetical protein VMM13_09175 [Euzebya sp.]|nr:hypothetical protein [Euzebya sp.]
MRSSVHLRVPEEKLARAGALGAVLGAVLASGAALVTSTTTEAVAVAAGAVLIGLLALAATPLYHIGGRAGGRAIIVAHLLALGLRLLLGVAIFLALHWRTEIPMTSFAWGIAVGLLASVVSELVAAARDPRFFWVDATPTTPAPFTHSGTERQRA